MESSIKNSLILKIMCYILIPIFTVLVIINTIYTIYIIENPEMKIVDSFEKTDIFANEYIDFMDNMILKIKNPKYYFTKYSKNGNDIYIENSYYDNSDIIKFVVIDNDTSKTYTNLNLLKNEYTIDNLKETILSQNLMHCYYNGNTQEVATNINNSRIQKLDISSISEELSKNSSLEIYTIINENGNIFNNYNLQKEIFNVSKTLGNLPTIIIPFLILLIIVMIIYLIVSIGHKKGYDGIYLNTLDKCPFEILFIISMIGVIIAFIIMMMFGISYLLEDEIRTAFSLIILGISAILIYTILAWITTVFIKKIKSRTLIKSSLLFKLVKFAKYEVTKIYNNLNIIFKLSVIFLIIIFSHIILFKLRLFILIPVLWIGIIYYLIKYIDEFKKIKEALKSIYDGNSNIKLDENEFHGELKEISKFINGIQNGFSKAINQSLKSERMKTELITNVSHDIKTPLTSIINYVDLLKEEQINNEKAKEYIGILDGKSQRLKKLIEDLVEASKASSGNIKLNIEKIDLVELLNQTIGEFEDKFNKKGLKVELNKSENNIYINADNRYMYRVIENLFSNISKYALENSRVYINILRKDNHSIIEIKNISKNKLNISAEELMQRFVRGDKSRTTEGSGLRFIYFTKLNSITKW